MTVTCPSCRASYQIDLASLGSGRRVRCARCRSEWFAAGAAPELADEAGSDPRSALPIHGLDDAAPIDAVDRGDPHDLAEALDAVILPPVKPKRARRGLFGARREAGPPPRRAPRRFGLQTLRTRIRPVAVMAALGAAACGAFIGERAAVVRAAPSLASFYSAVGLPVNVRGLAISGVRSVEQVEEGVPLLLVTGDVANVSSKPIDVPRLRLAVTGAGEREIYAWTTLAARAKLAPGESAPFRARLASPPADGRGIAVRFLARRDLAPGAAK